MPARSLENPELRGELSTDFRCFQDLSGPQMTQNNFMFAVGSYIIYREWMGMVLPLEFRNP